MTQEQKDLLIKDLCARVPYGVKYMRYSWNYDTDQELPVIETLEFVDKDGYIVNLYAAPYGKTDRTYHYAYCVVDGCDAYERYTHK